MIYYYFGSKEQLYVEVLEKLYGDIRSTESRLHLAELAPVEAIRRLVEFTFDHHDRNVDFVRIVSIENIHNAEYREAFRCDQGDEQHHPRFTRRDSAAWR
jgi:AcrR family transcriptional regulator